MQKYLNVRSDSVFFIVYATVAAFLTYTSMYAVRKAFSAATFDGQQAFGVDYKVLLVTAQTIGYTISKWIGIKIVAENTTRQRPWYIIGLVLTATVALGLFAITPAPYNILCLLLNGLPIGMIFGLVFNYLEGRRTTEILVVGLTVTQIFSSGFIKSIGRFIMNQYQVSDQLMPFLVALMFLPVLLLSVWMLEQLPPQSAEDIVLKSARTPIKKEKRVLFLQKYFAGITIFMLGYVLMTAYRDYRDNFAAEIWHDLGFEGDTILFTLTEIPVAIIILVLMVWLQRVSENMRAFRAIHLIGLLGSLIMVVATVLFTMQLLNPIDWICATGVGLYITYVPANAIFFERMIAVFRERGNAGFLVIMADFYGYLGSLAILFYKNFAESKLSYLTFFRYSTLWIGVFLLLAQMTSLFYFTAKVKRRDRAETTKILLTNI